MFQLEGKTAVIMGGTSTLGSAIAEGLAEYGANIAIVGRNKEKAEEVVSRLQKYGTKVQAFFADVQEEDSLQSAADKIMEWAGTIDILLNAPGKNSQTPFLELTMDEWDDIMGVNLKGIVLSCQIFSKKMIAASTPGSIINISSVSANTPLSKVVTYSASKAGVDSITKYLARELAPNNIRVNAIVPGFFPAEQNRKILDKERVESIMKQTPMNRFGNAEELKGAAIFLASNQASSFVTGEFLHVDGGFCVTKI
ncbi:SDR family oxidoreductase [Metabacillus arenae]|uniref:SDR family oxidoreductase n=1 Tax=Metabacillus arenae TaxID=2771434 RepID=A0A926RYX8_9BACI|nr:SDR family oxidoreductase [Metabacillus arenae]MBD1382546.1 SDR family oxidoreductase [Metabacillus arenae]